MLPQKNDQAGHLHLKELSIYVEGEADGIFNDDDYIVFYADGPNAQNYDDKTGTFRVEKNLYADENFYFLHIGTTSGKRINNEVEIFGQANVINYYDDFIYHENDDFNLLNSGREWYGEEITQGFRVLNKVPGIHNGTQVKMDAAIMSQSDHPVNIDFLINGIEAGNISLKAVPISEYGEKGIEQNNFLEIELQEDNEEIQIDIEVKETNSLVYLNYLLINFEREISTNNNTLFFRSIKSIENLLSEFQISSQGRNFLIWDVTDHNEVKTTYMMMEVCM